MDRSNAQASTDSIKTGQNKINIVAKKRPPPMSVGFNSLGIDPKR